jgi:hypothetical protein
MSLLSLQCEVTNLKTLTDDYLKALDFYKGHSDCIYDHPEPANPSAAYIAGRSERYEIEAAGGAE